MSASSRSEVHRPSLTVAVIAHDRKEFILEAIDSVLRGASLPASVDLLIAKSFEDPRVDAEIARHGGRSLLVREVASGAKYAAAVQASEAEVIAFLEDDDLFAPGKIAYLQKTFGESPGLGYLHHNLRPVDREGRPLPPEAFRAQDIVRLGRLGQLTIPPGPEGAATLASLEVDPALNASCIAVRRSILLGHLDELRAVRTIPDTFLFYAAAISNMSLCLTGQVWTEYRIHGSNASIGGEEDPPSYLRRLTLFSREILASLEVIRGMVATSRRPELMDLIDGLLASQRVFLVLRDTSQGRPEMRTALRDFGRERATYAWKVHHRAFQLGRIFLISPWAARTIYLRHKLRERALATGVPFRDASAPPGTETPGPRSRTGSPPP